MTQGQRGVAPLPAGLQRRFSEATPDSKAAQQQPNAGHQARREAGAQRTLYAVACMPSLGQDEASELLVSSCSLALC